MLVDEDFWLLSFSGIFLRLVLSPGDVGEAGFCLHSILAT